MNPPDIAIWGLYANGILWAMLLQRLDWLGWHPEDRP